MKKSVLFSLIFLTLIFSGCKRDISDDKTATKLTFSVTMPESIVEGASKSSDESSARFAYTDEAYSEKCKDYYFKVNYKEKNATYPSEIRRNSDEMTRIDGDDYWSYDQLIGSGYSGNFGNSSSYDFELQCYRKFADNHIEHCFDTKIDDVKIYEGLSRTLNFEFTEQDLQDAEYGFAKLQFMYDHPTGYCNINLNSIIDITNPTEPLEFNTDYKAYDPNPTSNTRIVCLPPYKNYVISYELTYAHSNYDWSTPTKISCNFEVNIQPGLVTTPKPYIDSSISGSNTALYDLNIIVNKTDIPVINKDYLLSYFTCPEEEFFTSYFTNITLDGISIEDKGEYYKIVFPNCVSQDELRLPWFKNKSDNIFFYGYSLNPSKGQYLTTEFDYYNWTEGREGEFTSPFIEYSMSNSNLELEYATTNTYPMGGDLTVYARWGTSDKDVSIGIADKVYANVQDGFAFKNLKSLSFVKGGENYNPTISFSKEEGKWESGCSGFMFESIDTININDIYFEYANGFYNDESGGWSGQFAGLRFGKGVSSVNIQDAHFSHNSGGSVGESLLFIDNTATMNVKIDGCYFGENGSVGDTTAGVIKILSPVDMTISNCQFISNKKADIYMSDNLGVVTVKNCTFENNSTGKNIVYKAGQLNIEGENNDLTIYVGNGKTVNVTGPLTSAQGGIKLIMENYDQTEPVISVSEAFGVPLSSVANYFTIVQSDDSKKTFAGLGVLNTYGQFVKISELSNIEEYLDENRVLNLYPLYEYEPYMALYSSEDSGSYIGITAVSTPATYSKKIPVGNDKVKNRAYVYTGVDLNDAGSMYYLTDLNSTHSTSSDDVWLYRYDFNTDSEYQCCKEQNVSVTTNALSDDLYNYKALAMNPNKDKIFIVNQESSSLNVLLYDVRTDTVEKVLYNPNFVEEMNCTDTTGKNQQLANIYFYATAATVDSNNDLYLAYKMERKDSSNKARNVGFGVKCFKLEGNTLTAENDYCLLDYTTDSGNRVMFFHDRAEYNSDEFSWTLKNVKISDLRVDENKKLYCIANAFDVENSGSYASTGMYSIIDLETMKIEPLDASEYRAGYDGGYSYSDVMIFSNPTKYVSEKALYGPQKILYMDSEKIIFSDSGLIFADSTPQSFGKSCRVVTVAMNEGHNTTFVPSVLFDKLMGSESLVLDGVTFSYNSTLDVYAK